MKEIARGLYVLVLCSLHSDANNVRWGFLEKGLGSLSLGLGEQQSFTLPLRLDEKHQRGLICHHTIGFTAMWSLPWRLRRCCTFWGSHNLLPN